MGFGYRVRVMVRVRFMVGSLPGAQRVWLQAFGHGFELCDVPRLQIKVRVRVMVRVGAGIRV